MDIIFTIWATTIFWALIAVVAGGILEQRDKKRMTEVKMQSITIYAMPAYFCERHQGHTDKVRCAHFGQCFIVDMRFGNVPGHGALDFVEDISNNRSAVECIGYFDNAEEEETLWQRGLKRLSAGEHPDPDI